MLRGPKVLVALLSAAILLLVAWLVLRPQGDGRGPAVSKPHTPLSEGNPKNKLAYLSEDDPSIGEDDLGPRKWKIVDVHEHVQGEAEARALLAAMDTFGIAHTALMASTKYTLTLNPVYRFEGFKENNEALIAVKKQWPTRFSAFVTFDPCDRNEDNLALVKDYVARGADGVKLYLGHGASTPRFAFHCMPIDDPSLDPFFAWAEEVSLPILLHVNLEKFWDELLHVLEAHPYLRMTLPHFGLHKNTEARLKRLGFLLERYPYVFTDVSFGFHTFQLDGFESLAKHRTRSRDFLERYAQKVLYASDMVLEPTKTEDYILDTLRSYLQFLEKDKWRFNLVPSKIMHGMGLSEAALRSLYEEAPRAFLLLDAAGRTPDRTQAAKVEVPRPAIPPLTPDMIPPLKAEPKAAVAPVEGPAHGGCEQEH